MLGYENAIKQSEALYKDYALLCAAIFDDLLELYGILDEHEYTVGDKGVVTFNDRSAAEHYNTKLRDIDEVFIKMKEIGNAFDRQPD